MRLRNFSLIGSLALSMCLLQGCTSPTTFRSQERISQEYLFAAEFLYTFFIFPDSLPKDTFGFSSPEALYSSVKERWTLYFPPDSAKMFLNDLTTQTVGMGIMLDSVSKGYLIKQVFSNSPAQRAGLIKGDIIDSINGVSVAGASYDSFTTIAEGNAGDIRKLDLLRNGGEVKITLVLGAYFAPSVFTDSLDSTTAYIYLSFFSSETDLPGGTAEEMDSALAATAWAPYTVLDLEGNPGGDMDQCVGVCGEFVPNGTKIIKIHEQLLDTISWTVSTVDTFLVSSLPDHALQRKFVVLVDSNTASAAEIFTSCIMSNRPDIKTVGTRTFGKARGQVLNITPDSALVKVTFALFTPILGPQYDLVGIVPAITIPSDSSAITVAEALISQSEGTALAKRPAVSRTIAADRIIALRQEFNHRRTEPLAYKKMRVSPQTRSGYYKH